jgi:hypothetical protein
LIIVCFSGGTWYWRFIYSYERWFDARLVATLWTAGKEEEVTKILSQPFSYCDQGSTSKVYVSQDGQFVLKTFLKSQFRSKGAGSIPLIQQLADRRKELRVKYNRSFGPIHAYQNIPKESGMIYYQFIRPTDRFSQKVELVEEDQSLHLLDLNQAEFMIQKKAILVSEYLLEHVNQGDLEGAKKGLFKLLSMTKRLYDQGLVVVVLQFLNNFGFVGDEPIRLDVEHIRFDPTWKEKKGRVHLKKELINFRAWIELYAPALIPSFDEVVEELELRTC